MVISKRTIWTSVLSTVLICSVHAETILKPYQALPTMSARDTIPFKIGRAQYLAVPQLAKDVLSEPANMNGGNADADVVIYKADPKGKFNVYQVLPGHGNETADVFKINGKTYLSVPSIESGPKAPYNFRTYSKLYEWDGIKFYPIQQFFAVASKSFRHLPIAGMHFLGLANGVVPPNGKDLGLDTASNLYQWDGEQFKLFQRFPTRWAYDWAAFKVAGQEFLALADHMGPTVIYKWNGKQFKSFQEFKGTGGRAFKHFRIANQDYLAYANIQGNSQILKWDGQQFITIQTFKDPGARNWVFFKRRDKSYLLRVNFITGPRTAPQTELKSPLYVWDNGSFKIAQQITTFGAVNAQLFTSHGKRYISVANSLSKEVRFRVDSMIYQIEE